MLKFQSIKNQIDEGCYLPLVLLAASLLRFVWVLSLENQWYFYDTVHYDAAARALLRGEGFGASLYYSPAFAHYCLEPLYPLYMAAIYSLFGLHFLAVRFVDAVMGVAQVYLLYRIALCVYDRRVAIFTAVFAGVYPLFVFISGLLYVTQIAAFVLTACAYCFIRYAQTGRVSWLATGSVALTLSILTQPVIILSVPLFILWILLKRERTGRRRLADGAILFIIVLAGLTPWTIRNYRVFDRFAFGRACMGAEGRLLEEEARPHWIEHTLHRPDFNWSSVAIRYSWFQSRLMVDYYQNGSYLSSLLSVEPLQHEGLQNSWGLIFYGDDSLKIEEVRADTRHSFDDTSRIAPLIDFSMKGLNWKTTSKLTVTSYGVAQNDTTPTWRQRLVVADSSETNYFFFRYTDKVTPLQARKVAILFLLDQPDLNANGYMAWLHPWNMPDLWEIRDGVPFRPVAVSKVETKQKNNDFRPYFTFISEKPWIWLSEYFWPEFRTFWSPFLYRITTESRQPSLLMHALAFISFLPLLLFSLFGIVCYREKIKWTLVLLIPILVTSIGYSFFRAEVRYRLIIDGFLIVLAAAGITALVKKFMQRWAAVRGWNSYGENRVKK